MNSVKTVVLLAALTGLLIYVGHLLGGREGAIFGLVFAGVLNFGSYWWSDKIVLRMYRAREVTEAEAPDLVHTVQQLATAARIPMPKVCMIENATPNAFATGRSPSRAAVAVTTGLMRTLDREELAGVLGHEISHVLHRDTLISTIAATIAGAIGYMGFAARWGAMFGGFGGRDGRGGNIFAVLIITALASMAALVIQMAISRSREYLADKGGAQLTGNPVALARALQKISSGVKRAPLKGSPATAHLFIVNPFRGGGLSRLFSTHPPMEERVQRLMAMVGGRI